MEENDQIDFLAAFGQEFCTALSPPVPEDGIVPQDAYEIWFRVFGKAPTPQALTELMEVEYERLTKESARYWGCPEVTTAHIKLAIAGTLARWPAHGA